MKKISPRVKGIVCILFAAFGFSMMTVFIRLAGDVPTAEKAFFRNIVALAMVGVLLAVKRVPLKPEKGSWPFITGRAVFGTIGMLLNFYAVDHLVLADANMLNKLSPFFAIIFSVLLLREKPTAVQIGGVLTALLGSVLIIKPGFEGAPFVPSLAGFISGAAAGLAYTFVRKLGARGENSLRIVFCFSLFSTLLTLPYFVQLADIFLPLAVNGGGGQDAEISILQIPRNRFAARSCHTHCMKEQHGRIPPVAICLKQH